MAAPMKLKSRAERLAELELISARTMGSDKLNTSEASSLLDRIDEATKAVISRALAQKTRPPRRPA